MMNGGKSIVCLGDSLTYGYPYGPRYSWVYHAASQSGLNLVNAGVNGDTLEDMAKRFPEDVLKRKPLAVVILGGTNDAFCSEVTIAQTAFYLEEMLEVAVSNGIQPVIGIPIPLDDPTVTQKLAKICSTYRDIAGRYRLAVLDFSVEFIDPYSGKIYDNFYVDGVHPNRAGYEVMGKVAAEFFRDYLCQR